MFIIIIDAFHLSIFLLVHTGKVTAIKYVLKQNWVLSTSRDKHFIWVCTKSGRTLGDHTLVGWGLAVEFDVTTNYGFVADYSGGIAVLKLEEANFHLVTTLRGHTSKPLLNDSEILLCLPLSKGLICYCCYPSLQVVCGPCAMIVIVEYSTPVALIRLLLCGILAPRKGTPMN